VIAVGHSYLRNQLPGGINMGCIGSTAAACRICIASSCENMASFTKLEVHNILLCR